LLAAFAAVIKGAVRERGAMKFDGNAAWKQASAMVAANRELVLVLAGVFFFLPSFALIMLVKQPQVPQGTTPEQAVAALQPFVSSLAPWLVVASVVQAMGRLTLIGLFGRGRRTTVGGALRGAVVAMASYLVVYLLSTMALSVMLGVVVAVVRLLNPLVAVAVGAYLVCLVYGRLLTTTAVIVLEEQYNPFKAFFRSLALTRGNGLRIGNFLFLLAIAFLVVMLVLSIVLGILASLTMGQGRTAEIVTGSASSVVTAAALAYFVAITVAIYRQVGGSVVEAAD
jgi:hypothetical protein